MRFILSLSLSLSLPVAILFAATFAAPSISAAQVETVLHSFDENGVDGTFPQDALIFDSEGNLYGTTGEGGAHGVGTVFELSRQSSGAWAEKILYSFNSDGVDGMYPFGGLIFDPSGNLYGTTASGGSQSSGIVFELVHHPGGAWTERILYSFKNDGVDGQGPLGSLVFDAAGNLYGTTQIGGVNQEGTVFELVKRPGGLWAERLVHTFNFDGVTLFDGADPFPGLIIDASGNLYGTTASGGKFDMGTVFELALTSGGGRAERILHSFAGVSDGVEPLGAVTLDASGNLYGVTNTGGAHDNGIVFELSPSGSAWSEKILYSFKDNPDGRNPFGGVVFDAAGNLYGTTTNGGSSTTPGGTVYQLTPGNGGDWTESILYNFSSGGKNPLASLVLDSSGNLYGTTQGGGRHQNGTVFEVIP